MFLRRLFSRPESLPAAARRLLKTASIGAPGELLDLLENCTDQLLLQFRHVPTPEIAAVLIHAWTELSAAESGCYVDLATSTRNLIWLVDPVAGCRRPIPVVDLVKILGPRIAA